MELPDVAGDAVEGAEASAAAEVLAWVAVVVLVAVVVAVSALEAEVRGLARVAELELES